MKIHNSNISAWPQTCPHPNCITRLDDFAGLADHFDQHHGLPKAAFFPNGENEEQIDEPRTEGFVTDKALHPEDDVLNADARTLNTVIKSTASSEDPDVERDVSYGAELTFTSGENADESASFGSEDDTNNSGCTDMERDISGPGDGMSTYGHNRDVQRHVPTLSGPASARYEDVDYEGDALTIFENTSDDVEDTDMR